MRPMNETRSIARFDGSRRRVISLPALFALVAAASWSGACSSSSSSGGPDGAVAPPSEDAAVETSTPIPVADGGTSEAGEEAGAGINLGFYPSNVACALTGSGLLAAVEDAGIDLSMLADVDFTAANEPGIHSDQNVCGSPSDCSDYLPVKSPTNAAVVYTTLRQSNGIQIGVYIANSWTVEAGATLTLQGSYPIALVALTDITVYGAISGASDYFSGNGPGGYPTPPGGATTAQGQGPGGGPVGSTNGADTGGGGASYCGVGGAGGGATTTTPAYGNATVIPLQGGSSGGTNGGGPGGGAIELVAGTSITVSGTISAGGAGGLFGSAGGGSGGALLLEAPAVTVTGALAANGGGGGSNGDANAGMDGQASAVAAPGGAGPDDGATGGVGSAGMSLVGAPGELNGTSVSGGGGGAGYIRINTMTGSATLTGGILSPSAATTCTTQGMLSSTAPTCN